jgi:hypothetical protein
MSEYRDPELRFAYDFVEREQYETNARGDLSYAQVRFKNGLTYSVYFYDIVGLSQTLADEEEIEGGNCCVAESGMILVPEITLANMQQAVEELSEEKDGLFFRSLNPISGPGTG